MQELDAAEVDVERAASEWTLHWEYVDFHPGGAGGELLLKVDGVDRARWAQVGWLAETAFMRSPSGETVEVDRSRRFRPAWLGPAGEALTVDRLAPLVKLSNPGVVEWHLSAGAGEVFVSVEVEPAMVNVELSEPPTKHVVHRDQHGRISEVIERPL